MAKLKITNNTLLYGTQLFQIHNITQIRVEKWKRKPRISGRAMFGFFVAGVILCLYNPLLIEQIYMGITDTRLGFSLEFYIFLGLCFLGLVIYGLWDRTQLKLYTLYIETNSGSSNLFTSRDKNGIHAVANAIQSVMENRDTPVSYHVNVDQSKITLGDEFSHIGEGVNIVNRSTVKND